VARSAHQGGWIIVASFMLAFVLAVFPLPASVMWARPDWVALVLIYWVIALPQRFGIVLSFTVGMLQDVLEGAMLGHHALSLSVVAYLGLVLYQRLRLFNPMQQAGVVFVMVGINQLVGLWMQNISGLATQGAQFLMPVIMSALLWPGVMSLLRFLRRRFEVN
jgi:rod shape-determining protein MreD